MYLEWQVHWYLESMFFKKKKKTLNWTRGAKLDNN